jgi:mycothiol S-conjugate amidase
MSAEQQAPRSILTIHAHPDDESSKGPGTISRYARQGVRTTLVCCTGGEAGDVLNPALADDPAVVADLPAVRAAELKSAAQVIGYDEVVMLGYRDSGMPDTDHNAHPEAFANADHDEAVGRLVEVIRRVRPQVVVTYPESQRMYPHPDHLRVTDISLPAFDLAGDPTAYPEAGRPWSPSKLYATVWSRQRVVDTHQAFLDLGLESPFDDKWLARPDQDHLVVARIEVENRVRRDALLCHVTQVDPESPFWFGLPEEVQDRIHPYDDYSIVRTRVPVEPVEDDLFAGVDRW